MNLLSQTVRHLWHAGNTTPVEVNSPVVENKPATDLEVEWSRIDGSTLQLCNHLIQSSMTFSQFSGLISEGLSSLSNAVPEEEGF